MTIPTWWQFALLGLAAWRTFQLLAHDEVLDRPRRWVLRLDPGWEKAGDPVGDGYRLAWAKFLTCPYCFGFWLAVAWWIFWQGSEHWSVVTATPFALSAVLVAGAKLLASDEAI